MNHIPLHPFAIKSHPNLISIPPNPSIVVSDVSRCSVTHRPSHRYYSSPSVSIITVLCYFRSLPPGALLLSSEHKKLSSMVCSFFQELFYFCYMSASLDPKSADSKPEESQDHRLDFQLLSWPPPLLTKFRASFSVMWLDDQHSTSLHSCGEQLLYCSSDVMTSLLAISYS